jgi:hypothetical protein
MIIPAIAAHRVLVFAWRERGRGERKRRRGERREKRRGEKKEERESEI